MGGVISSISNAISDSLNNDVLNPGGRLSDPAGILMHKSSRTAPGQPDAPPTRDVNQSVTSTVAPANIVYGTRRVGGVFGFYGLSGTNGEYLWYVQVVACHEVNAISNLVIDGNYIDESAFTGNDVTSGPYAGLVSRYKHLGTSTQTVDTTIDAAFAEWTTAFTGKNLAYVIVRMKRDDTAFPQIPQSIQVDVQGKKVYDPRLDSTVTGGSGSQRFATPSTWTYSNNAILCTRDYLADSTSRGCLGWPAAILNDPTIITQANNADASIAYTVSGVTLHQNAFTIDGVLTTDQTYGNNLALMLNCINGTLDNINGLYTPVCGQYNSPSLDIDHSWFISPARVQFGAKPRDQYNSVRGKYYDNQQNYQELDYPPFSDATYVSADGGVQWRDLDLSLCTDIYRCERLGTLVGRQSRNQQAAQVTLDWRGLQLALGMNVRLTIPNLFTNKVFTVNAITVKLDGSGLSVMADLLEDSATAHSWTAGDAFTVTFPVNPAAAQDTPMDPTSFTVTAKMDGYHLGWTPPADGVYFYIEIWRSFTSAFAGATLVNRMYGDAWIDTSLEGVQAWYWLRAVSIYRTKSNYAPSSGGAGATDATWPPKVSKWSSRARFNMTGATTAGFYAVAKIPGEGAGPTTRGQGYVHIGYNSAAGSGILIKFGNNTSGNGSLKIEYINQLTSIITQMRMRQDPTTGDTYVELNFASPATASFCVDVYPDEGTYASAASRPVACFIAHPAGASATIVATYGFGISPTQVLTGHSHFSGAVIAEYSDGSKYRNGVITWDTDGMISSQFRNPALIGPGYANAYVTGLTVTPHPTSLNFDAFTLHLGQETVVYNSSSKTGLANSTLYHGYFVDKTMAGGTKTLNATTSGQIVINNNANVYICDATTQSAGGTGGGGGASGCVAACMFLAQRLRARYAHIGDWLDVAENFVKRDFAKIENCSIYCEPCVRLEADDGSALICSETTPFTLEDGTSVNAPDMKGKKVLTDAGTAIITEVKPAGTRHVMRISCGGLSFAAGEDPTKRIYSHNVYKP